LVVKRHLDLLKMGIKEDGLEVFNMVVEDVMNRDGDFIQLGQMDSSITTCRMSVRC